MFLCILLLLKDLTVAEAAKTIYSEVFANFGPSACKTTIVTALCHDSYELSHIFFTKEILMDRNPWIFTILRERERIYDLVCLML